MIPGLLSGADSRSKDSRVYSEKEQKALMDFDIWRRQWKSSLDRETNDLDECLNSYSSGFFTDLQSDSSVLPDKLSENLTRYLDTVDKQTEELFEGMSLYVPNEHWRWLETLKSRNVSRDLAGAAANEFQEGGLRSAVCNGGISFLL